MESTNSVQLLDLEVEVAVEPEEMLAKKQLKKRRKKKLKKKWTLVEVWICSEVMVGMIIKLDSQSLTLSFCNL